MAVLIEGVGLVHPDDDLNGKSTRDLNKIMKALRGQRKANGKLTASQQKIFDNAQKMKTARANWRDKTKIKNADLRGATIPMLRANRKDQAAWAASLKAAQKRSNPKKPTP